MPNSMSRETAKMLQPASMTPEFTNSPWHRIRGAHPIGVLLHNISFGSQVASGSQRGSGRGAHFLCPSFDRDEWPKTASIHYDTAWVVCRTLHAPSKVPQDTGVYPSSLHGLPEDRGQMLVSGCRSCLLCAFLPLRVSGTQSLLQNRDMWAPHYFLCHHSNEELL
jgi:hypothetical protein